MSTMLLILLSLLLLYLIGLIVTLLLSVYVLRRKLRRYQESGRFGY